MERTKKYLRTFFGLPVTLLSFVFLGKVFFDNRAVILTAIERINIPYLLVSVFFFLLFFATKAFIWIIILRKRGHQLPIRHTIFYYSISEIKRFIPGSVFAFIGRVNSLSHNVPYKETIKGIGIEAILLICSAFIFSIPAFFYLSPRLSLFLLIIPAVLIVVLLSKYRKVIFKYIDELVLFLLAWLFFGLGCMFVGLSITYIPPDNALTIFSLFILSWLIGYLSFITPMGLGIRELALTGTLSFFIPAALATTIALFSRLAMIVGEIVFLLISAFFYKLKRSAPLLRIKPATASVGLIALLYFFFMSLLVMQRHSVFLTGRFDLGNMTQTVWNTSQGRFFTLTNPDGTEIVSRLAVHSDFILVLFTPLYWLWSDPQVLLLAQTVLMAIGGIYVYKLAQYIIRKDIIALAITVSYFLNFWLHEQNLFDFHAVTLATPFIFGAFYYLLRKRYWLFFIFLTLATLTKENIFLVASIFGFYFIFREKKVAQGIIFFILAIAIFYYLSSVAIPNARGAAHFVLENYNYLGGSVGEIAKNSILKPQLILGQIFNHSTLLYVYYHLLPTGFLAVLSPWYLIFTLPEAAIYLLSGNFEYRSYEYHFGAAIIPFIYIAMMYTCKRLLTGKKFSNENALSYYIIGFSMLACYLYSPLPGMRLADNRIFQDYGSDKIQKYISIIPAEASVAASNNIGGHLSHRKYIYVIPFGIDRADYIVLSNEKDEVIQSIDTRMYDELIHDKNHKFFIFKRKILGICLQCKP